MKKKLPKTVFYIALICFVFGIFLFIGIFAANNIGVSAKNIEADIRSSQKIADDWSVEGSISDNMAAYISYPEDKSDHTFSLYVTHSDLSFGYFFRAGGSVYEIEEGVCEFNVSSCNENAYISMNRQSINKLEANYKNGLQVIDIDSDKPFAVILPANAGNVTFYDINGNTVKCISRSM